MNAVFRRWAEEGLVWLPERGMGWLNVHDAPYDAEYFDKYARYAETDLGRAITASRVDLTLKHQRSGVLVDVGIGSGAFVEARRRWAPRTFGYDVNPAGVEWLATSGYWLDPYAIKVDAVSLWDVLEHIPDPAPLFANVREWVFCSLPIVPGDGPPPADWKHLRRDEHCLYFTRRGLIEFMEEHGFRCVEHSTPETLLGREDIETFAFRRA